MFPLRVIQFSMCIFTAFANEASTKIFSDCDQFINQHQFIIQSTGYPNGYPGNINCEYRFQTHETCATEFHFQFLDFDLENSINCTKDRLEIKWKDQRGIEWQDKLCGFITGTRRFKTTERNMTLKFVSNYNLYGRGFKILITKQPCNDSNSFGVIAKGKNGLPHCCVNSYNARRFYLASPGFPYTNNVPTDCLYYIYRSNPNICRLRIHLKFFWSGIQQGIYCSNGFLEIDGKPICGCRTGLDVISQFDQFWGNQPKIIRFRNEGFPRSIFSGFVLEVIQDECPTRYSPSLDTHKKGLNTTKGEKVPEFYFYNDQLNRIIYPNSSSENLTTITKTHEEIMDKVSATNIEDKNEETHSANNLLVTRSTNENQSRLFNDANVKIDYYFYKAPDFDSWAQSNREPREYFETTSTDFLLPNGNDDLKCRAWGILQWTLLTKDVLWTKMPQCKVPQLVTTKCCEISNLYGYLVSPGYPFYYPRNLNICYRFRKHQAYCGIKLSYEDFDLELSENCQKDALVIDSEYKYCGNVLTKHHTYTEFKNGEYEDIRFISDNYYCGRGFQIYYEQVPCQYTSPYPPPMTTTQLPIGETCGGLIMSEYFEINFQNSIDQCVYHIHKADQNVCGLQLLFTNFNLLCGIEYLSITNRQYCGNLNGQNIFVSFDPINTSLTIVYKRNSVTQSPVLSSILLKGQQIKGDCEPFIFPVEVPAQRRLKIDPDLPEMMQLSNETIFLNVSQGHS